MGNEWDVREADEKAVSRIVEESGLSPITAHILVSRGIDTPDRVQHFLTPSLARDWFDPFKIPDISKAVDVLESAIREKKRIVIFGDFDLDGVSSTALLTRALKDLGAQVIPFVPLRFEEGYGLSESAIERVLEADPDLVVTVDCGVSNGTEIETLVARGVEVIVTDHHEPSDTIPKGIPVVDPKLDPECPSMDLAGAGVALKLVQVLMDRFETSRSWIDYVPFATLGTVADLMPLLDENRALVFEGIKQLKTGSVVGIKALCDVCGTTTDQITASGLSYTLIPRFNAAGRMGDPTPALMLLLSDDYDEALTFARELDENNKQRKKLENELSALAFEQAEGMDTADRVLVVAGEGWHEGIRGIIASQLAAKFAVPSFVLSIKDGVAQGSGRTVGGIDLFEAAEKVSDLFIRYGGHKAAVGITLAEEDLPELRRRLNEHFLELDQTLFTSKPTVDCVVDVGDISFDLLQELDRLRPFGQKHPSPLFAAENVFLKNRARVGPKKEHLRFSVYDGSAELPAIAFRCKNIETLEYHDAPVGMVFEPTIDVWRGSKRLQLFARKIVMIEPDFQDSPAKKLVEDMFSKPDDFYLADEYVGVTELPKFYTKLVGVSFDGRQEVIRELKAGDTLTLERETNEHDVNACVVKTVTGKTVGYLNKRLSRQIAPLFKGGKGKGATRSKGGAATSDSPYEVRVAAVTGAAQKTCGLNVLLTKWEHISESIEFEERLDHTRLDISGLDADELDEKIVRTFIGSHKLLPIQAGALEKLDKGISTFVLMATGRGKSCIFQIHAAKIALTKNLASVFVFPLRALIADQKFHLQDTFSELGLVVEAITGDTSNDDRRSAFARLASGGLDVVLTTPEFFAIHKQRFADAGRIGFVAVDEAHHVAQSTKNNRPLYKKLGETVKTIGSPVVLATSATARNKEISVAVDTLGIEALLSDPTIRKNLTIEDRRNIRDKDDYLVARIAHGGKAIVYVNSRAESVRLARMIRKRIPHLGHRVAFYNGGLTKTMRNAVESAFRNDELCVIVATSAFGEGVNIPDITDIFLYHIPFGFIEFNQQSGRAGRNGKPASIHLLFGQADVRANLTLLKSFAPSREDLICLYRVLLQAQQEKGESFEISDEEVIERARALSKNFALDETGIANGIDIFKELDLVFAEGTGEHQQLTVLAMKDKVDLRSSMRYLEDIVELEEFVRFKEWVFRAKIDELQAAICAPILPKIART